MVCPGKNESRECHLHQIYVNDRGCSGSKFTYLLSNKGTQSFTKLEIFRYLKPYPNYSPYI